MEYRDLGKTGLRVSRIGFGGEHVTDADFATTEAVMRTAMEAGVNIMDVFMPQPDVRSPAARTSSCRGTSARSCKRASTCAPATSSSATSTSATS